MTDVELLASITVVLQKITITLPVLALPIKTLLRIVVSANFLPIKTLLRIVVSANFLERNRFEFTHETVRVECTQFAPLFAQQLRAKRQRKIANS